MFVGLFVGPFNALMYDDGVLTGFFGGVLAWLFFGGMAHIKHLLLRSIVVRGGFAPWRYIHFLEYATERLFLRRIGGGYIFVHRLLLEHFASLPVDDEPAGAKARLVSSRAVHSL
ncbi:MAG: hypothetical protein ACRDYA_24225 [Egibacteraceae bacterium]